ncbi:MAG: DUF6165 family protein [Proteobacteria bacterium]|nr:DUF6165 family protein [Pseudomonadota bacterium]
MPTKSVSIEISPGELIDKITILMIKSERVEDPAKLENVRTELALLDDARGQQITASPALEALEGELKSINEALWEIEDDIRDCERAKEFGDRFIELARAVYKTNDERSRIKRSINELLGSSIMEEKSYQSY